MYAKTARMRGPKSQPIWATLHGTANTPDPIIAVIACAVAVQRVPEYCSIKEEKSIRSAKGKHFVRI